MGFRLGLRFGPGSDLRIWVVADSERPRVFDVGLANAVVQRSFQRTGDL